MLAQRAPAWARVVELWRAWTRPSPELTDRSEQWRARLLAALMLAGTPLALAITVLFLSLSTDVSWVLGVLPLASVVLCYALARTRYFKAGAWLTMVVIGSLSMIQMAARNEPALAMFVGLTITLGAMILRKRDIVLLTALTLLGFFTMPLWSGAAFSLLHQVLVGGFFVMLTLTLWISVALRDRLEQERIDALAKSEARFRGLLQLAFEGLVELKDGRIVELNPGFVAITGRSESELLGRELSSVVYGERPSASSSGSSASSTASHPIHPSTREATGTRPSGEVFHVEMVSRTLSTDRGPIEHVAVRDITERRKAELQLSIAHRAVALGTLSAGIAHEINNPLSWMMTNLQMAQDELRRGGLGRRRTPEQDSLLHTLDDALQGGRRVMSIVRDLKTMSREGGDHGVADVHAALDLACRIASRQIEARARLVRDYGHVPSVHGSAGRLGQVFLNLLTNAAQAIPEGQRDAHRITLRTRSRKGQVIVTIRDTGPGIPSTVLPHIFDPFYTTKDKEGTGLGLSITRSVVDGLGGSISVESREGDGTTFTVHLPVTDRQLEPDAPEEVLPSRTSIEPAGGTDPAPRVRVLVIDDEPLLGKSLRRALPEHDVVFTEDPTHALDLCSETDFDVIVCDLMMPVIDGQDVYEHLRQNVPELATRMIFMTGGAFTTGAQRFLESIDNPVLHKPFTPNDLRVAVKRMLESHAA